MRMVPMRLRPGDDLRLVLETWMGQQREEAGCLVSGIGSLAVAPLRLAGQQQITTLRGDLEILCLTGTLSADGAHLHIAIADRAGVVTGGHLGAGSLVRTTAELVGGVAAGVAVPPGAGSSHRLCRAADHHLPPGW